MLSVRDLVRQIPAEWQENVKHRAQLSYGAFLDQIRDPERATRIGAWFWGVQEIPEILDRWGQELPPQQVHLVTVPPPGGAPELLWKRFSQAFGLDGIDLDLEGERHNPSLGVPETTLLRRINRKANAELAPADYRPLVRELLAHQTLSRRTSSAAARAAAGAAPVGPGAVGVLDRRDRALAATTWSVTWATSWGRRRWPSTPTRTGPGSGRSPPRASTRSPRCSSTTPGSGTRRRGCRPSSPTCAVRWSGPTRRRRTASAAALVLRLENSGVGRALLGVYRRARGRSSRSA